MNILTLEEMENVRKIQEVLKLTDFPSLVLMLTVYNLLSPITLFQSVSMPVNGLFIPVVFSATVVPHQITLFLVLVMMLVEIGKLRTLGELNGEKKVSLD